MAVNNVLNGRIASGDIRVFPISIDRQTRTGSTSNLDRKISEANLSFLTTMCYDPIANQSHIIPSVIHSAGTNSVDFHLDGFVDSLNGWRMGAFYSKVKII